MPIRSGAMQRPRGCRCGNTLRQRYDEVGLPCSSTMGLPSPSSTYAISLPRIRRRCFWYGNAAEIMFAPPVEANYHRRPRTHNRSLGALGLLSEPDHDAAVHVYGALRRPSPRCASLMVVELAILTDEEDALVSARCTWL